MMSPGRVYHRHFDPEGQDSLAKLARLVRPGSQVLDLGTGPGQLGAYLRSALNCVLDGVEAQPEAAAQAAIWYRQLECADLEQFDLAACFADRRYDYILCADVLEHLRRPGALLAQLPGLLSPGGRLLASVPNVAYAGLIAELLAGDFRYRPEGLLDESHLRFFTLHSLYRLLAAQGWRVVAVDAAYRDWCHSEFIEHRPDALPPAVTRALLGRPDALVYQFLVSAEVAEAGEEKPMPSPVWVSPAPELRFSCQLFWRAPGAAYQEKASTVGWGRLGEAQQSVLLPIPAQPLGLETLRLDLADRPGLLRLHAMRLISREGCLLWAWDGRRLSLEQQPRQQLEFAALEPLTVGVTVWLAGEDPALDLPIPATALAGLRQGGVLELELSWPMSLDYLALVQNCVPRRDVEAERAKWTARLAALEQQAAAWHERQAALEAETVQQAQQVVQQQQSLAAQALERQVLSQQLSDLQLLLVQKTEELAQLRLAAQRSWRTRLRERIRRWRADS